MPAKQFERLQTMFANMEKSYLKVVSYFCFNPVDEPMEKYFSDIQRFIADFRKALDDNIHLREAQEKKLQMQQAHERALKEKQNKVQKEKTIRCRFIRRFVQIFNRIARNFLRCLLRCRRGPRRPYGQSHGSAQNRKCLQ